MSNPSTPPALPKPVKSRTGIVFLALILLSLAVWPAMVACNVARLFSIPSNGMSPAIQRGDKVVMKGYMLGRAPRRGEIVVFKTDNLPKGALWNVPPGQFFTQRVAGEPGDRLRIEAGELHINDNPVALSNAFGKITFVPGPMNGASNIIVPPNSFFVLGDNGTNSLDSRYFGPVGRKDIIGRITTCYWPRDRAGAVR
jgi:signal peptidase I